MSERSERTMEGSERSERTMEGSERSERTMEPSAPSAARAILDHCRYWNAMDKASWLTLFADDIEYEDPPGTVASRGIEVMSTHAWDGAFTAVKRWILEPVKVIECGREAQVYMRNHGAIDGVPVLVESIELWRVDDAGRVDLIRAFWEPPQDPAIHAHLALATWDPDRH